MILDLEPLPEPQAIGIRKGKVHLTDDGITALCGYRITTDRIIDPIGDNCERCLAARDSRARLHRILS